MRVLKVALAFFLIGFLAGSLDAASGLGSSEQPHAVQQRYAESSIARSTARLAAAIAVTELAIELRAHASSLPPEVAAGVKLALAESLPDELRPSGLVRSPLFLPQEPDWWEERHEGGPRRLVTFGPRRPLSMPGEASFTPLPELTFVSFPPEEPIEREVEPGGGRRAEPRDGNRSAVSGQEFIMPFERGRVTSLFNQGRHHPAIDLAGPLGTPVHATTQSQRVTFTGWRNGYGNTVMTRDGGGRTHLYAHLQRITAKVGMVLDQGQRLGHLGSTGRSTGPHVHYEVHTRAGQRINPVTLLFPGRRIGRGFAWNGSRSVTRFASNAQPLPR